MTPLLASAARSSAHHAGSCHSVGPYMEVFLAPRRLASGVLGVEPGDELVAVVQAADGSRIEVPLPKPGDVLIAVGGGPGRWRALGSGLLAVGYQLGVLSPAQNFYLEYSPDEVRGYPLELQ